MLLYAGKLNFIIHILKLIRASYYDGYLNKLCTRTLYELDSTPHARVDDYMKYHLQNKLIRAILKDSL